MKFSKIDTRVYLFILLILLIGIGLISKKHHDRSLKKDHLVVCAAINKIWVTKAGINIKYEFDYKGEKRRYNRICTDETRLKFHKNEISRIMVVLQNGRPDNNALLEKPGDFERYDISTLDSQRVADSCR